VITIAAHLEGDVAVSKTCAGIISLVKRHAQECIQYQQLLARAAKMFL
jgi:glutamine amidotransferase PdxT